MRSVSGKMRIVFMGTPKAAVPSLARLVEDGHDVAAVWTQPDRPSGRGRRLSPPPVKQYAVDQGIPVHQPHKIKTASAADLFRSHEAECAVVVAYGRILPKAFLDAFPRGCINVHFSLLPKYRGAAPVNWAIVRGEKVTGVTTMLMDEGLDTGDILLKRETPIGDDETAPELMERLSVLGADLISETIAGIDQIEPIPQDHSLATMAPMMTKKDGEIDWSLTAIEIERRVRGFQPFPRSYTFHRGSRLTLWSSKQAAHSDKGREPGEVLSADSGDLVVACGGVSALRIVEIQAEGKRRMSAADFLNGSEIRCGEVLGE